MIYPSGGAIKEFVDVNYAGNIDTNKYHFKYWWRHR